MPVCNSITGAPAFFAASICAVSGPINKDTRTPASLSFLMADCTCEKLLMTSKPPSVVRSSRRSGTKQTSCGATSTAMAIISSVTAHSRFIRVCSRPRNALTSASCICRRSSRKCKVILSAPDCSARSAACTTLGYFVPRAWRMVAT